MRKPPGNRKLILSLLGLWGGVMAGLFILSFENLQSKEKAQREDTAVSIAVDWHDVELFSAREKRPLNDMLLDLKNSGVSVLALSSRSPRVHAQAIRKNGFKILWRTDVQPGQSVAPVFSRMRKGDGILSYGNTAVGYPSQIDDVAQTLQAKDGFYPLIEFSNQKGKKVVARRLKEFLIKGHCLQSKEQLSVKTDLWEARLVRAVKERWVRFLYLQLSPAQTWDENMSFQKTVVSRLRSEGFELKPPVPFKGWSARSGSHQGFLILLLSLVVPLLILMVLKHSVWSSVVGSFIGVCVISLLSGVVFHAMGAHPNAVLGLSPFKGVKAQLLGPLVLGPLVLLKWGEVKTFLKGSVRWSHVVLGGGGLIFLFGVYLMRSGNFPLLAVTDTERFIRDGMEVFFGARPRLKEFLIGHPLLILGLVLVIRNRLFSKGRWVLLLGLFGQISILNTFLHFHTPIELGILRTFHGVWLGGLVAVPAVFLARWMGRKLKLI